MFLELKFLLLLAPLASTVTDTAGQSFPCSSPPKRIVALAPSLAEIVWNLGAGESLVGVASRNAWAPGPKTLADVGPFHAPDLEKTLSLQADLILALKESTPQKLMEKLRRQKSSFFLAHTPTLTALLDTYAQFGCLLGKEEKAREITKNFHARLALFHKTTQSLSARQRPTVLLISTKPVFAANRKTFLSDLFTTLGFHLAPLPFQRQYPELDSEWVQQQKHLQWLVFDKHGLAGHFPHPVSVLRHPSWLQPSLGFLDGLAELEQLK